MNDDLDSKQLSYVSDRLDSWLAGAITTWLQVAVTFLGFCISVPVGLAAVVVSWVVSALAIRWHRREAGRMSWYYSDRDWPDRAWDLFQK